MLQTIRIETSSRTTAGFTYQFFDEDKCVFTALDEANQGSSINWAEDIAKKIAERENKDPLQVRFFDLQTHVSYPRKPPRIFEFDEVRLKKERNLIGFRADGWLLVKCPEEVLQAFSSFLDDEPQQLMCRPFEAHF